MNLLQQYPTITLLAAFAVPVALLIAFIMRLSMGPRPQNALGLTLRELFAWVLLFACAGAWAGLGVALSSPPLDNPAPLESEIVR